MTPPVTQLFRSSSGIFGSFSVAAAALMRHAGLLTSALKMSFRSASSHLGAPASAVRPLNSWCVRPPCGPGYIRAHCWYRWSRVLGSRTLLAMLSFLLFMIPMARAARPTTTGPRHSRPERNFSKPVFKLSTIPANKVLPKKMNVMPLPVTLVSKLMYFPTYSFMSAMALMVLKKGVSRIARIAPIAMRYVISKESTIDQEKKSKMPPMRAPSMTEHAAAKKTRFMLVVVGMCLSGYAGWLGYWPSCG
mmetsp:Transcript_124541/g.387778  ORF Transcript_124541/g.387778 Transcript_124541/m.387778 type:complete len:248 (+) Transcript_124541:165-908(+)